ncbi:Uncharacterised protein [Mycobacteroides abscessus subsp. abscessus]|nr:Uncharacterised protein [Mycobacteroides abscessus subsp. abscessus]
MPMAPCSWTAFWPMKRAARPTVTLAAAMARLRSAGAADRAAPASWAAAAACSSSMYMSTMRCCRAWKLPIGTPNCWRCLL